MKSFVQSLISGGCVIRTLLPAVIACVLWGSPAAIAADGLDKQVRIRQTADQQRDIREEAIRTVAVLKELSEELVFNRFRDPALTKNVAGVGNTLEKAGGEYMERAEQDLKSLLNLAGDAAIKGKLDEVIKLQDRILEMLKMIRNARLAADRSRLQRLLETALRNQRGAMERTKALLFDPLERVASGKSPEDLPAPERQRLTLAAGLQDMAHHSIRKAVDEFLAASTLQDSKAPQQAEAARKVHVFLTQAKVTDKAASAKADLERNRSTQALMAENEVIQALEAAIGLIASATSEADRKLSELAREREDVADLLEKQKELRKDTETLSKTRPEDMKPLEARQDRLAKTAEELKEKADDPTMARQTMEQVKDAMERAEKKLSEAQKAPALDEMKAAEKGLEAALMAIEKQMDDVASEKKPTAEEAEKKADALRKEAEAAAQMSKDLEAAAKKEEEILKDTQKAADQGKESAPQAQQQDPQAQQQDAQAQQQNMDKLASAQEQLQQQVQALQQAAERQPQSSPSRQNPAMQEASNQMKEAMQAMQQASQQLKQNNPESAQAPEKSAQQSLEQAARNMQKTEQALRAMEQAERAAAMAARLNEMAEKEAGLQQQADKAKDPSAMQKLRQGQQELAGELSKMRQKEQGLGPKAQEAEDAMKKAQSHLEAEEKSMGGGQPPQPPSKDKSGMSAAKKEMMNAQAALQQMAGEMQQAADQMRQGAEQGKQEAADPNAKPPSQSMEGARGLHNRGDPTVRMGERRASAGWEAAMSERGRVQFGQDADRMFPPEYAKMLEGYYRRLAAEKNR